MKQRRRIEMVLLWLILYCICLVQSFNINNIQAPSIYIPKMNLVMKGKAPWERNMSKRKIYVQFREAWDAATKIPGFFDEEIPEEIDLYCKSNRDGKQVGDCPFAQFIQLFLARKGVQYKVIPTLPARRPEWILDKHDGRLPVIVNKLTGESVSEPVAIAEYLENIYPEDTLRRNGTTITYIDAIKKFTGFYPALYNCITNKDPKKDGPLFKVVIDYIDTMDEMIRSTPGKYLCGIDFNMADLYLTPLLWNAQVSLDVFKQYELMQFDFSLDPERPALEKYMKYLFSMKEFNDKRIYIHVDKIIYGWKVFRNEAPPPFD